MGRRAEHSPLLITLILWLYLEKLPLVFLTVASTQKLNYFRCLALYIRDHSMVVANSPKKDEQMQVNLKKWMWVALFGVSINAQAGVYTQVT
jgi:hypothetical protein